jgi:outer membrane receptor protein involved in Fe transport
VTAPLGVPFVGGGEDCRKDRTSRVVYYDPTAFPGIVNGGVPFVKNLQRFGTLELNYEPIDDVSLTSVTGYYNLHSKSLVNTSFTTYAAPLIAAQNPRFRRRDVTQELRLNSDFDSPVNFTLGAFYQDGKVSDRIVIQGNTALPFGLPPYPLNDGTNSFRIKTYSGYGQLRWKVTPELELAGGARYTDETRRQKQTLDIELQPPVIFPGTPRYDVPSPTPRLHSSNVSPEATITYKPTQDLTVFAAYKKGYKSGSFSIATPAKVSTSTPRALLTSADFLDNSFGDERVQGFEGGVKGRAMDRQLNFSLTGYRYNYKGLQVGAIEPVVGTIPTVRTVNAGSGRAYGAELEVGYSPRAISGLSLNGAVNWNHARFQVLNNVPCTGGQTVANGCNQQLDPTTGLYFAQDLSGGRFIRAPEWAGNVGFDYEIPVGTKKLVLSNNNHYSSKYLTLLGNRPEYYQNSFVKTDISLSLQGPRDRWEIAIIGKNVTNKLTTSNCNNGNFAAGLLAGTITGGNTAGPAGVDELGCYMDPGRELWLRVTLRPFN